MANCDDRSLRERVTAATRACGVLPCIKVKKEVDYLAYAQAMYDGGARVIEVTMTCPDALEAIGRIAGAFAGKLYVAAGTVLDAPTARAVILRGGSLLVSPTVQPEVIRTANRYGVPFYSGAFTATECQAAMEAGAAMVKVFPAQLGGPKYMTNLKMVFPEITLIPSGGVSLENAAEFIRCGACAVSGARCFMQEENIAREGVGWITRQVACFVEIVRAAKENRPELP